jgi:hypothetical protein
MSIRAGLSVGLLAVGILAMKTLGCSSDDTTGGGSSSGSSGDGSSGSSGASGTSGGTSGTSGGTSGTSGGPIAADDGLIPTTSIWRTTSEWFREISAAPVAGNSGEMIGALAQWGTTGVFQIDFSFNVLNGQGAPTITLPPDDESDAVPVPVPAKGYIEGDFAYNACPDGEDCHMIIFDLGASRLYEVYQAHENGSTWSGGLAMWKLDKAYPQTNRGLGCTSGDAAGMAIAPGLIGYKETKKGAINHALRFIIRNDYIRGVVGDRNVPNVVYPGSHGTTAGAQANGIPYGGRLRLKQTITDADPRVKTPGGKALLVALHKYGMILSDGGNIPLVAESAKVYQDTNPAETWDGLLEPRDLGFIKPSDFEVIAIPKNDPSGAPGWYETKADYISQLKKPLGCAGIVQP